MYQPFNQPFNNYYSPQMMRQQPQTVTRVAGISSARQMPLPPNSSAFALDYDDEHVYYVYTDGAGVAKADAYKLVPCADEGARYATKAQFDQLRGELDELVSKLGRDARHAAHASSDSADQPR